MTVIDIADLRAKLAARKEPWEIIGGGEYVTPVGILVAPDDGGVGSREAELIVAAVNALPALLDEIERLRESLYRVYVELGEDTDGAQNARELFGPMTHVDPAEYIPRLVRENRREWEADSEREEERHRDEIERLRDLVTDMAQHGLRFDLNPTLMMGPRDSVYGQMSTYMQRMDQSVRERARAALEAARQVGGGE